MALQKDKTVVWIVNSYGVKSAKEAWLAKELLKSHRDWDYCDPEDVPGQKVLSDEGGYLTEEGKRRRKAAEKPEPAPAPKDEISMTEIREMCKEKGIRTFGRRKADLIAELGLNEPKFETKPIS